MARIHNFSAGPGVLPEDVLREAQEALWDFQGTGVGVMECSHRTKTYEAVVESARQRLSTLLGLRKDQHVLFLPGAVLTLAGGTPQQAAGCGSVRHAWC